MADVEKHNEQIVRQFFEALSSGDLKKLCMMLHEQATWDVMVTGIQGAGEKRGRKTIIDDFLKPVREGLFEPGDPKVLIQSLVLQGPRAGVEAKGLGKLKNGKEYDNRYAFMIEIKDDRIFPLHEYIDSYYMNRLG